MALISTSSLNQALLSLSPSRYDIDDSGRDRVPSASMERKAFLYLRRTLFSHKLYRGHFRGQTRTTNPLQNIFTVGSVKGKHCVLESSAVADADIRKYMPTGQFIRAASLVPGTEERGQRVYT